MSVVLKTALVIILLTYSTSIFACIAANSNIAQTITFPSKTDLKNAENDYAFQLLQLVLEKSKDKYGNCKALLLKEHLPAKRIENYLIKDHLIDIAALTVNNARNELMLPVKIPIAKGLRGYRLFMIRKSDADKFAKISSLNELANFRAGQGAKWADVNILRSNKLPVVTGGSINTLINMLEYKRFDYFPRGTLELMEEIDNYNDKAVQLESTLALIYPNMTAFYVNKDNIELAHRIEYGLNKAIEDGSFNTFFYSHPSSVDALKVLSLSSRRLLTICNPNLPHWVPINVSNYWLQDWPENFERCSHGPNAAQQTIETTH